ncbi:Late embryogenesis abundant hydroxyproline-rich glycoprotein family [Salvia divinorum]|uniref:Late embryogenesis abundant hydroxyproline-rich glycoprotein family n=1 Tax=Salvia divinorum TaxID=28513 RepID=A0ABD1GK83_SALDI
MTAKDCGHDDDKRKKLHRLLLTGAIGFLFLVLFLILLIWLILQPSKPHFVLQDVTVFAFNLSATNTLSTTVQVTLAARNSNERIGIYYDRVDVYVAYHGQQITLPTLLPPTYQGHKDSVVWSPFLYGDAVPVAPYLGVSLNQDQIAGTLMVNIRVRGRIRWKVGTFISGGYHLYVNCPAYINSGGRNIGISGDAAAIKYQLIMDCHVDV